MSESNNEVRFKDLKLINVNYGWVAITNKEIGTCGCGKPLLPECYFAEHNNHFMCKKCLEKDRSAYETTWWHIVGFEKEKK